MITSGIRSLKKHVTKVNNNMLKNQYKNSSNNLYKKNQWKNSVRI